MNCDTGELRSIRTELEQMQAEEEGFIPVPRELEKAANKKLGELKSTYVSLNSGGKLSNCAKKKRKEKQTKLSQKKNRKKIIK